MNLGLAPNTVPIVPLINDGLHRADSSVFGLRCRVHGKVMGIPGPHEGVVLAILQSGRVLTHVFIPGGGGIRKVRVITDPTNVGIEVSHFNEPVRHPLYVYYAELCALARVAA